MLEIFKKRLCPLMSLALAFGCGKKINDPESTEGNRTTRGQQQELPANLTLQINEALSSFTTYKLPSNAWFKLPTELIASEGSAIGTRVKIYYNLISSGDYEFHCYYQSISSDRKLLFENCESSQGAEVISAAGELEGVDFPMDKDASVKLQLIRPSNNNVKIESTYRVNWK